MERKSTHKATPAQSPDARMEKAISACLKDHELSFTDALAIAGFQFFRISSSTTPLDKNNLVDSDLVTLKDRIVELKTQLRFRITEKRDNYKKKDSSSSSSSPPPTTVFDDWCNGAALLPGSKEEDLSSNAATTVLQGWTRESDLFSPCTSSFIAPSEDDHEEEIGVLLDEEAPRRTTEIASSSTTPARLDDHDVHLRRFDISGFIRRKTVLPILSDDDAAADQDLTGGGGGNKNNDGTRTTTMKFAPSTKKCQGEIGASDQGLSNKCTQSRRRKKASPPSSTSSRSAASLKKRARGEQVELKQEVPPPPPPEQQHRKEGNSHYNDGYVRIWGDAPEEDDKSLEASFIRNYGLTLSQFWEKVSPILVPASEGPKPEEKTSSSSSRPLSPEDVCNRYSRALATLQKEKECLLFQCMRSAGFEEKDISDSSSAFGLLAFAALKVDVGERWPSVSKRRSCHVVAGDASTASKPSSAKRQRRPRATRTQQLRFLG